MLFNGRHLVKTINFGEIRNLGSPIQQARVYNSRNVDELIFIDMAASAEGRGPVLEVIKGIIEECFMPLTVGGGIHYLENIQELLRIGADKISINSEAIGNPSFIEMAAEKFGSQCVVVSIDVKKINNEYRVFTNRGCEDAGFLAKDWAREVQERGAGEIFLTSIDRDGTMGGYDTGLIKEVSSGVSIPVIACGGAGKVQDIIDAVKIGGADAVSLASMFHYSGHTVNSIKQRMVAAGIPMREVTKLNNFI